ncbi:iron uptake protein [Sphingomonas sp. DBB INV C78]|uniref:DUF3325 family protein n=1 Tax=Sphingomonas sp. DBB INV C78 TaxID=3349434 RepID=UPI0036D4368C
MQLEPALISYAGLACWALSTPRLRRNVAMSGLPAATVLRVAAVVILGVAAWRAVRHFGPYQGWVAWAGMLSLAGIVLLLLLSRWPRAALGTGVAAIVLAVLSAPF